MSENVCANVILYKRGRLEQGYSLNGDRVKVTFRSRGFSIVVIMQDDSDAGRAQASVKMCGHEIFNTEDHVLEAPKHASIATPPLGDFATLEDFEIDLTTRDDKIAHP